MEVVQRSNIHGGLVCPLLGTLQEGDLLQRFYNTYIPWYNPGTKVFDIVAVRSVQGYEMHIESLGGKEYVMDVRRHWSNIDLRRLPSLYYFHSELPGSLTFLSYKFQKQFSRGISLSTHSLYTPKPYIVDNELLWWLYNEFFNQRVVIKTLTPFALTWGSEASGKFAIYPKLDHYAIYYGSLSIGEAHPTDGKVLYKDKRFREELKVLFPAMSVIMDYRDKL